MEDEIFKYETQLAQVELAISETQEGPEKNELQALAADLKELISLSKNNLKHPLNETKGLVDDPLAEEYSLFKAELDKLEDRNENNTDPELKISGVNKKEELKKELEKLQGTKCRAPFMYKWSNDISYHNALISHVPNIDEHSQYDDIEVKVMFINPTHKEMQPCPYYLQGDCKFNDDKCKYSHGEFVLLSSLKDYSEPNFSEISKGSQVFAKEDDELWYRAQVLSVSDNQCNVRFELNSKEKCILLHNILPLDSKEQNEDRSLSEEDSDLTDSASHYYVPDEVTRIFSDSPGTALGEWEKFTKGFGSRIMAKMGYIHGAGLGKDGVGRVEPVPVVVLPAGKSLDHCMMLKEKSKNNDLFKVERKLKQRQKKHEEKLKKAYEKEKNKSDVFVFLNTKLVHHKEKASQIQVKKPLKNESIKNLNVTSLQLSEEVRKLEKEIKSLNQSLARNKPNSPMFNIIKEKLVTKGNKLVELQANEKRIEHEQDQRRDRKKLTIF